MRADDKKLLFSGYVQSNKHRDVLSKKSGYLAAKEKMSNLYFLGFN